MSNMEKLLTIVSIGQRVYGKWLFQKLMPGIIMVIGLTIVISIIISMLLVGGFYAGYVVLLAYDLEPDMAMLIIGISSLLTIILLVTLTILGLRNLNKAPQNAITHSLLVSGKKELLASFLVGLVAGESNLL